MEIFKTILEYPDYEVSNLGRIRSKSRKVNYKNSGLKRTKKERILKPGYDKDGYKHITLYKVGKKDTVKLHRLVGKYFVENPLDYPMINHKDGCKTNNRVENLEWCNNSQNMRHAYDTGLQKPKYGENNRASKLSVTDVLCIRELRQQGFKLKYVANLFGVSESRISAISNNKSWKVLCSKS